jgi:putative MATE family efflux protein
MATERNLSNPLLTGTILSTLLRLSLPNVLSMTMAVLVGVAETYYIGVLGITPLAAMALVFPFAMLTGMLSGGAMGGGVSSAISRALGAGDLPRAQAIAMHAVVIGGVAGAIYTMVFLTFGPVFYRLLGGFGAVLKEAVGYSNVLFCGAILVWLNNTLASILRGTGNMKVPSLTVFITALLQILFGGALGLGVGTVPRLGMTGVALGHIVAMATGVVFLLWYLKGGRGRLKLSFKSISLKRELFTDILKVGGLACVSPLQSVLTILIFTGFVARIGVQPLAGYGIGQRLEFILIPITFGIGVAAVPMVGMAIGAGNVIRARRVAWTAGGLAAFNLGVIGGLVSIAPDLWATNFTRDSGVLEYTRQYLRWAGPAFALYGLGLALFFAAQGSGKILGPVLAGTLRLALVAGVGAWLASRSAPAGQFFALIGVAMTVFGISVALALRFSSWTPARRT